MKQNKGFSTVELLISFSLTMVIVVILFEIVLSLKNVYENSITKSELVTRQNLYTDYIYSDINDRGLNNISICGEKCLELYFDDSTYKQLSWDYDEVNGKQEFAKLTYGNYTTELINKASFGAVNICYGDSTEDYSYVKIHIPIYHDYFSDIVDDTKVYDDFGINIVKVYESGSIVVGSGIGSCLSK